MSFDELLLSAVDRAFLCLGSSSKDAVYFSLKEDFRLPRKEIPARLYEFSEALERLFGIGSRHLEILIMKELNKELSEEKPLKAQNYSDSNISFTRYVKLRKQMFEKPEDPNQFLILTDSDLKPTTKLNTRLAEKHC
jgi:hypothetical protein